MCGIFGLIVKPNSQFPGKNVIDTLIKIAQFSESRGKDSSGLAIRMPVNKSIQVIKGDIPIRKLLKSKAFEKEIQKGLEEYIHGQGFTAFGHARLVTNGSQLHEVNNQPVLKDGIIIIHNGIIVNVDKLWKQHPEFKREYLIDTEIIPALIRKELRQYDDLEVALNNALNKLEGTFSVAAMFEELDQFVLATNNGSLYYISDNKSFITFTSEGYFLEKLQKENRFRPFNKGLAIKQLNSNQGLVINLNNLNIEQFGLLARNRKIPVSVTPVFQIRKHLLNNVKNKQEVVIDPVFSVNNTEERHLSTQLEYNIEAIRKLRRCTKCLLPETFPFIEFNNEGTCNYCVNHKPKNHSKPLSNLIELVEPYRSKDGKPDCIVPFSGGRDSTFTLHHVKATLKMNPIAFTYDWGMVTDLGRRNIARVCGKLGVENIIVSADLHWKRKNIRQNIIAWLKRPDLGMVPLFMAGDKYFFYYTEQLKKQTGIDLNIWGINNLENTDFKVGFCRVKPDFNKKRIYSLSASSKIMLIKHIGKNLLTNPSYFNSSVPDTIGSFISRYRFENKDYYHFFDYYNWNENEIEKLLHEEYNWETATDTKSTWRIGDGTAGFYNYIYFTVAGFSEYDTFRSNQIREGMITREEGLKMIEEENRPRYSSIKWYTEIVGLDFESTIKRINQIPKLYPISITGTR